MRSALKYIGWAGAALTSLLTASSCQHEPEYGDARPNGRQPAAKSSISNSRHSNSNNNRRRRCKRCAAGAHSLGQRSIRAAAPRPLRVHLDGPRARFAKCRRTPTCKTCKRHRCSSSPNLTVNAEVNCPNVQSEHISSHTLNREQLTKKELEAAIAERASVVTVSHNRVCTIEPKYVLAPNGMLHADGARELCAVSGRPALGRPARTSEPEVEPRRIRPGRRAA